MAMLILQRPSAVRNDQKSHGGAAGAGVRRGRKLRQGWAGRAQLSIGRTERGVYADPKGSIWLGGDGKTDNRLVKFTRDGKFVMQIGHKGQSKGNTDTVNVNQAADTFFYAPTNGLFVADGYGNRRIIVFDADTRAFKRMWGAFGNPPRDNVPAEPKVAEGDRIPAKEQTRARTARFRAAGACGAGLQRRARLRVRPRRQARPGVHARRQVRHAALHRPLLRGAPLRQRADGGEHAFSHDPEQQFLYVASRSQARLSILDRKTLSRSIRRPAMASRRAALRHART